MKKGCFLKFIIIFTILLAASLYVVQNKFEELIFNPGKELILKTFEDGWEENLNFVKESETKDELKSLLERYITKMKSAQNLSSDKTKEIAKNLESTFKDSIITPAELSNIRKLIEKELLNEE